jgi:spermidine synthase
MQVADVAGSSRVWRLSALALLFFGSGLCSLVYQVLWLRMLGLVFGVTVYAASTVWATFMAGLAVGSFAAGVLGDRVRNPLRWFGITELLIGVTSLATPAGLDWLQRVYVAAYVSLSPSPAELVAVRVAIAFAVLIVPTALMGATLPLVIKASTFRASALGRQVGLLYGSNAGGAIVGTLAAGLYLIPTYGIRRSLFAAAGLNLCIGLSAIALSTVTLRLESADRPPQAETAAAVGPALSDGRLLIVLGVFTLSGVVSLALEVVWFRVLTLFLRPTVYGFAVMLATILAGISLGSYLVTPLLTRRVRWMTVLAALQLATGFAIVASFRPLTYLTGVSARLSPIVSRLLPEYLAYPIAGSLLAIFPTALLMGLAFPIGLHLWASAGGSKGAHTAGRVGLFYSLNVAGAIVGALLGGFVLLPQLGSRTSVSLLAAASFASGLALLAACEFRVGWRVLTGVVAAAAFAAANWFSPDPFGQFVENRYPGQRIVWQEEGVEATVVVHERRGELSLTVNGNHEASTGAPMTFVHRRIGHLPMALHAFPQTALVIGLGGGATAGAVGMHTGVQVDIVELAEAVSRGARFFGAINHDVLSKPNVHLRIDDGRNYMMLTTKRYDVITADVILPIWAGAGNLYSAEYFRLMRRVLGPGGLVLQWVAGTEAEYKLIARTFLSVFPETTVWAGGGLLVGSVEPLRLRQSDFEAKLAVPGRAEALRDLGVTSFDALLSTFVAGPDELRAFVGDGPFLTDDRPLAEYFLSLPRDREPDTASLKGDVSRYVVRD